MVACNPVVTKPPPLPAILINGQSNAVASVLMLKDNKNEPHLLPGITGPDLLSWSGSAFYPADGDSVGMGTQTSVGVGLWGAHLGRQWLDDNGGELAVINRGAGGKALAFFLPGTANYDLMHTHVTDSGVEPFVYVIAQGESDGADLEATSQAEYFAGLCAWHAAIRLDYPTVEQVVIVGTSSATCGGDSSEVRAAQVQFADSHPDVVLVDVDDMTNDPLYHTGCHYTYPGYQVWADRVRGAIQS